MAISNTSAVTQLFEAIQYRAPDAADLVTFVAQLNGGQVTLQQVQTDIENAPYTVDTVDPVIREYQAAFGRVPDQAGVSFWVNQLAANPSLLGQLNVVFANSAEFMTRYGVSGATAPGSSALISAFYQNVLNRAPDPAGLAFWLSQNLDAAQLLQAFAQSQEFINNTANSIIAFQNLEAAGTPPPPTVSLFSLTGGSTFILTKGMDNVNGFTNVIGDLTPYSYNGIGPTLNTGDHISNVNTLTVTDQFAAGFDIVPAGAVISNVTNVVLETAGNAGGGLGGSTWDTSGISGVVTSTVESSGTGDDAVKALNTTDVTVTHNASEGSVEVLGGHNINISTNGDDSVLVGTTNLSPAVLAANLPTGTVTVLDNGAGGAGAIDIVGGTTIDVTITSPGFNDAVYIGAVGPGAVFAGVGPLGSSSGPLDPTGDITVTDASQSGEIVAIFGGANVSVTAAVAEILVGDPTDTVHANQPTGNVTVADGFGDVAVSGGVNVVVNTDGNVGVGDIAGISTAAGIADTTPTGTVNVTDSSSGTGEIVGVVSAGGAITINSSGTDVEVGGYASGYVGGPINTLNIHTAFAAGDVLVAPTTDVTIVDNAPATWSDTTGFGHEIFAFGGHNVSVTTNTAVVQVGGFALNAAGTAALAGENPAGNVTVVSTATSETNSNSGNDFLGVSTSDAAVLVYGGANVSVTAAGADVTIGTDVAGVVIAPSGAITVTNTATDWLAFDDVLTTFNETVDVLGGAAVSITTNAGGVLVGEAGVPSPGAEATGAVTVVDNSVGEVQVYGGAIVSVTSAGGNVFVGDGGAVGNSAATNPTGTVTVTDAAVETGAIFGNEIAVQGAGAGAAVSVTTTGGSVWVGEDTLGNGNTPVTGAVTVTDTYGGLTHDSVHVLGGTTVNVTLPVADIGGSEVTIGEAAGLNTGGTALLTSGDGSTADSPTGNVTVTSQTGTAFGTEFVDIWMNGGTTATVTGAGAVDIQDVQSELLSSGLAAGTSLLSTVNLTGVTGAVTVQSDAIATITDNLAGFETILTLADDTANSSLTFNMAGDVAVGLVTEAQGGSAVPGFVGTLTVNATGPIAELIGLDLPGATAVTLNDTASLTVDDAFAGLPSLKTITVTGAGNTSLGRIGLDVGGATPLIDAHTATGAVYVEINPTTTTFNGGSGANIVTLSVDPGTPTIGGPTVKGGGGNSTIYQSYAVNTTPLGATSAISGFANLGVIGAATGAVDALGFAGLVVGGLESETLNNIVAGYLGVGGNITFNSVELGASLDLIDTAGAATITYNTVVPFPTPGSLAVTIGQDANLAIAPLGAPLALGTGGNAVTVALAADNIATLAINSQGQLGAAHANALTITEATGVLKALSVTGDANLTLHYVDAGSVVNAINAGGSSGAVDVSGVAIGATGATFTGGTGFFTADGSVASVNVDDTYNVGSGGGFITLGAGGAGFNAGSGAPTGAEAVNLTADAATGTVVFANLDITGTDGSFGKVMNFDPGVLGSGQTADVFQFNSNGSGLAVIANTAPGVFITSPLADGSFYTISGGVISLGSGSPVPSASQELKDAQLIVEAASTSGFPSVVAMVQVEVSNGSGGTVPATFLIESDYAGGLPPPAAGQLTDVFVELQGTTGLLGFAAPLDINPTDALLDVGAGSSVAVSQINPVPVSALDTLFQNLEAANNGTAAGKTYTDTGITIDTLNATSSVGNTYKGMNNFAVLRLNAGAGGVVAVTQAGAAPLLELTANAATTLTSFTYGSGSVDPGLQVVADAALTIHSLVDASNTAQVVEIVGTSAVEIDSVTGTALKTINALPLTAGLTLTDSQAGSTLLGSLAGDTVTMSGTADVISIGSAAAADTGAVTISAGGATDHITVVASGVPAVQIGAGGTGDVFNLTGGAGQTEVNGNLDHFHSNVATTQLGATDTFNVGAATDLLAWLGANSTVNLLKGTSTAELHLLGDAAGASLTNLTTITGVAGADQVTLHFNDYVPGDVSTGLTEAWAGGNATDSQVNMSGVSTLAAALNLAAHEALHLNAGFGGHNHTTIVNQNTTAAAALLDIHTGILDWFQWNGNTYIVESVNNTAGLAAHAGLAAGDMVVELTGLVNVPNDVIVHFGT